MHAYIYVCNNSLLYLKAKYISIIKPSGLNKFSKKKKKKKKKTRIVIRICIYMDSKNVTPFIWLCDWVRGSSGEKGYR